MRPEPSDLPGTDGSYRLRRSDARIHLEPSQATVSAIAAGLRWLARHQNPDGRWSAAHFDHRCSGEACSVRGVSEGFDSAVTGLAVLAFLEAGYTPTFRATYTDPVNGTQVCLGDVVRKGLRFLIDRQSQEGFFFYETQFHDAIATYAVSRAYEITSAVVYRQSAERAIHALGVSQVVKPKGAGRLGWGRERSSTEPDAEVTGWCLLALDAARLGGLNVPESMVAGAQTWLASATGFGDTSAGGCSEGLRRHPTATALGLSARMLLDPGRRDNAMARAAKVLKEDLPAVVSDRSAKNPIDFSYWFWGSTAMSRFDGPGGPLFLRWNKAKTDVLVQMQCSKRDGCADGSWPGKGEGGVTSGGRVYATALNVLTLETPPPDLKRRASRW